MLEFDVIDRDGEWLAGQAPLGVRDPFTQVMFPYLRPVRIRRTSWVTNQFDAGVLKACADPLADVAPVAPPKPVTTPVAAKAK